jgi:hypothetical protein
MSEVQKRGRVKAGGLTTLVGFSYQYFKYSTVVTRKYYRNRSLYAKARRLEKKRFVVDYSKLFSIGFKQCLVYMVLLMALIFREIRVRG